MGEKTTHGHGMGGPGKKTKDEGITLIGLPACVVCQYEKKMLTYVVRLNPGYIRGLSGTG
jgi:hypothetical protein